MSIQHYSDDTFEMEQTHQSAQSIANPQMDVFASVLFKQDNQEQHPIHKNNTMPINHRHQYQTYFDAIEDKADQRIQQCNKSSEEIIKHKITRLSNQNAMIYLSDFQSPKIQIIGSQYQGMIINYEVFLGNFKITLNMLNKNTKAPNNLDYRGKGAYGTVYNIRLTENQNIVCKRSYFKKKIKKYKNEEQSSNWQIQNNKSEIEEMIGEYAFYKLCSFYRIGPSVIDCLGFDLVCFSDSIEFYMEQCYRYRFKQKLQTDLKLCLRILHKMNIIHKDIKPSNILYSNTHKSYILTDYGISHPIEEKPGQFSKTYKEGTQGYFYKEMNDLSLNNWGYVDLYFNDMFALITSVKEMNRYFLKQKYIENSLDNQRINKQYAGIKLLYMILNAYKQLQVISFIKQCDLYKEFFYLSYLIKCCHPRYTLIRDFLISSDQQFIQYENRSINKCQFNHQFVQKKLSSQQTEFFIRVYGMTDQLILQLDKYDSNSMIENIKYQIKSKMVLNRKSPCLEYQKIISGQSRYIRYLEKQLQAIEWEQLKSNNNIHQQQKINIYFVLLHLKMRQSFYYSQLIDLYQLLTNYVSKFSFIQKIRYQFSKILLQTIKNRNQGEFRRQKLRQLLNSNKKQALMPYRLYFCMIGPLLSRIQLIRQCQLFLQCYGEFNIYCYMPQFLEIYLYVIRIGVQIGKLEYFDRFNQLQLFLIQNYNSKHYLCIDFFIVKADYFLQSYRIPRAISILQQVIQFIKEIFGQNSFKLQSCYICLGICYFYSYEYQKSQLLLVQASQKIRNLYGEFNTQYLKCLELLISLEIKKQNLVKIQHYYSKQKKVLQRMYIDSDVSRTLDSCLKLIKFYSQNNLIEQVNRFMIQCEKVYLNSQLDKSISHYDFLILQKQYYVCIGQQQKLYKVLNELKKIVYQPYLQIIKIKVLRQIAYNYLHNLKYFDYAQAQTIYEYIVTNTKSLNFYHIESLMQLGKITYKNNNIAKAYNYFNQSYDLFKKSQIYDLVLQINLVQQLGKCLSCMERPLEALLLYQQTLRKVQEVKYRVEGKLFLKLKVGQLFISLGKLKMAKKYHRLIIKQICQQTPNIDKIFDQYIAIPKKLISSGKMEKFKIYGSCLSNLYQICKKVNQIAQAIYYFQKIKAISKKTMYDTQSNVYLKYCHKDARKTQLAFKKLNQEIKKQQYSKCLTHSKLICYFIFTKNKMNVFILLTLLFAVIQHMCQYSMLYYPFYKKNYQNAIFKRCRTILKSTRINKKLTKDWAQSLRKIALCKRMQFLNKKFQLSHSTILHQTRYNI